MVTRRSNCGFGLGPDSVHLLFLVSTGWFYSSAASIAFDKHFYHPDHGCTLALYASGLGLVGLLYAAGYIDLLLGEGRFEYVV
jgi:hypothetical protein